MPIKIDEQKQEKINKNPVQTTTHLRNRETGRIMPWTFLKAMLPYMEPCDAPESDSVEAQKVEEVPEKPEQPIVADKKKATPRKKAKPKKRPRIRIRTAEEMKPQEPEAEELAEATA